jgi:CubicO group peptidase (beta-lactamase class C family)
MLKWLVVLALALPMAAKAADLNTELDRDVPACLTRAKVPSVSIAVIRHGRLAFAVAYGEQSPGVPVTPRTLYNIASLSKPLSAEVILREASKGVLSLDELMAKTWTDPDIVTDARRLLLTPRLALSHRSGFPNWRDSKTGLAFLRAPGEAVGYSGEGFQYVAHFTELKAGKPFEDLAQSEVFGPLGLKDTAYTRRAWFDGRIALPTTAAGETLKPLIRERYLAADDVYTTASDYAVFMLDTLHDKALSPAIAAERDRIQASTHESDCRGKAETCPTQSGFGLGWQIMAFPAATVWMHTGKDEGLFTFAYLNRTTGDGAVILTNSDNGAAVVLPILEWLGAEPALLRYLES